MCTQDLEPIEDMHVHSSTVHHGTDIQQNIIHVAKSMLGKISRSVISASNVIRQGLQILKNEEKTNVKDEGKKSYVNVSTTSYQKNLYYHINVADKNNVTYASQEWKNCSKIETENKLGLHQGLDKDKYIQYSSKLSINKEGKERNDDDIYKREQGNRDILTRTKHLFTDLIQILKKPETSEERLVEFTSSLVVNEGKDQIDKVTPRSKRNKRKVYSASTLNYYWPLDPDHKLHKKEFLEQIKYRQINNNPWKQSSDPIKTIAVGKKDKEETEIKRKATKWKRTHLDMIQVSKKFYCQTKEQYLLKIESVEYKTTMSELKKRTPRAPLLNPPTQVMNLSGGVNSHSTEDNGWTTVRLKKVEKKIDERYSPVSDKFVPTTSPEEIQRAGTNRQTTSYILPLMIRITKPKNMEEKKIHLSRTIC
jgi:hypothetical protein